ncbi:hypothetical protein L6164_008012 [Bauhinia variegata]|uniref:Uncharacterized protein n=1 Tax=Bauhinia variegata TaxID=167791 RepID=A0ACB9PGI4_BAUVA|nr:hypothetical protein L6164_008012 [Bauhinia variegata]
MTGHNHGKHPHSSATFPSKESKRRVPSQLESSSTHIKRRRLVFKSETSTRNTDRLRSSHTSNRFEVFRSSSRSRFRKRRGKSSSGVCSRVFSSQDFSNNKDNIVVVSYNILGVENASKHLDLYCNIPRRFLDWDRRKRLIHEEIKNYNASILCFQEVDHFDELEDLFQTDGFKGVYKARTGEANDGCAIFWKQTLYTLLHREDIEFQRFGLRNNVAQLCVLEGANHEESESDACTLTTLNKRFLVGNIHVLFNPNRGDIKLGQVRLFLDKAYKLSQEWGSIPVIIGCDLNSVPQSAIYEFVASSKLDIQLYDRRNMSGQIEIPSQRGVFSSHNGNEASIPMSVSRRLLHKWSKEELRLATGTEGVTHLKHHLKLRSAYIGVPGNHRTRDDTGEPLATSYHSKFLGTVDYIWHTKELVPVRVVETLPIDILRRTRGLPSEKWGSDHLAIVCEFAFTSHDDGS